MLFYHQAGLPLGTLDLHTCYCPWIIKSTFSLQFIQNISLDFLHCVLDCAWQWIRQNCCLDKLTVSRQTDNYSPNITEENRYKMIGAQTKAPLSWPRKSQGNLQKEIIRRPQEQYHIFVENLLSFVLSASWTLSYQIHKTTLEMGAPRKQKSIMIEHTSQSWIQTLSLSLVTFVALGKFFIKREKAMKIAWCLAHSKCSLKVGCH